MQIVLHRANGVPGKSPPGKTAGAVQLPRIPGKNGASLAIAASASRRCVVSLPPNTDRTGGSPAGASISST